MVNYILQNLKHEIIILMIAWSIYTQVQIQEGTKIKTNIQHIKISGQDHFENGQCFYVTVYLWFYLFGM